MNQLNPSIQQYNGVIPLNSFLGTVTETYGVTSLDIHSHKLQNQMANCRQNHIIMECIEGHIKILPLSCLVRICPICELSRRYKIDKRIFRYFKLFQYPKLLTLTFAEHRTPDKDTKRKCELYCREFRRSLAELPHDLRLKYHIVGKGFQINGFRFLECEPKEDGFHIHFHYVIDQKYFIPQKLITELWLRVTGDSFINYIQPISNKKGLEYALKYSSKPMNVEKFKNLGISEKQILKLYLEFFYKTRMWTRLGIFYDMKLKFILDRIVCPECGSTELIFRCYWQDPLTKVEYKSFNSSVFDRG